MMARALLMAVVRVGILGAIRVGVGKPAAVVVGRPAVGVEKPPAVASGAALLAAERWRNIWICRRRRLG